MSQPDGSQTDHSLTESEMQARLLTQALPLSLIHI